MRCALQGFQVRHSRPHEEVEGQCVRRCLQGDRLGGLRESSQSLQAYNINPCKIFSVFPLVPARLFRLLVDAIVPSCGRVSSSYRCCSKNSYSGFGRNPRLVKSMSTSRRNSSARKLRHTTFLFSVQRSSFLLKNMQIILVSCFFRGCMLPLLSPSRTRCCSDSIC